MNNHTVEAYLNERNKLDGSNYSNWKFKFQTLLEAKNTWAITSSDELKPTIAIGGTTTTIQDWEKREAKAKVSLKLSVKYCIIPHIQECKLATDISTTLKDLYKIKKINLLLFLKCKILSIKMEENELVVAFISRIKELRDKQGGIGVIMPNINLITITMNV